MKLRNKYLTTIYSGLIDKKTIKEIHKDIREVTKLQIKHNLPVSKKLEQEVFRDTKVVKRKVDTGIGLALPIADVVFETMNKEQVYQKTNSTIYEDMKSVEAKMKEKVLWDELRENERLARELKDQFKARVFYLASSHNDSAEDHEDYQGKIYIDKNWKNVITNPDVKKEVQKYINKHSTKTFQWVIGRPVWFITRPNCRHYFKALPVQEVIDKSVETLIRNHKMHTPIGREITRTMAHDTRREWYKNENVENIIKRYKERLAYHEGLYKVKKSETIKRAIEKDRLLIRKWANYLQTMK